jgi:hypothetical protein
MGHCTVFFTKLVEGQNKLEHNQKEGEVAA